jgi:hypothetical protein
MLQSTFQAAHDEPAVMERAIFSLELPDLMQATDLCLRQSVKQPISCRCTQRRSSMFRCACQFTGVFVSVVCLAGNLSHLAKAQSTPPDFAVNASVGWYAYNRQFIPPLSGAGPVQQDRARPYVSNDEFRVTGKQPTEQLADLNNPILQPWARDLVRKRNELVLSGRPAHPPHASCWPVGVPGFLLRPMTQAMYFVQTPKVVVMILSSKQEIRRVYLTEKHSPNVKPSWYGESIGHYEGDTLVVDTIGIDERTWVDGFGTPHTKQLHVIERLHLIEDGRVLEANVSVNDPGAFTTTWNAIQRFRQYEAAARQISNERRTLVNSAPEGPLAEQICADNPNSFFPGTFALPVPQAVKPGF